ncbi:MAG: hypothetical protein GF404_12665 [candidate division Zixibacteria bacterium]|nr:hypothetical protein [candidate division Zixibacteria bacterium]
MQEVISGMLKRMHEHQTLSENSCGDKERFINNLITIRDILKAVTKTHPEDVAIDEYLSEIDRILSSYLKPGVLR